MTLILIVAPKILVCRSDRFSPFTLRSTRAKGFCASRFGVTQENHHPWFWTLIGVDQALHHLTGFGLSIFMAAKRLILPASAPASRINTLRRLWPDTAFRGRAAAILR